MWISSGVPITERAPEPLARRLLAEHDFWLFSDADNPEHARSVRKLGFVSRDAELILLAEVIRDKYIGYPEHPLALASRWTAAGVSAKAALSWLRSGTLSHRRPTDRPWPRPSATHDRNHCNSQFTDQLE
jgi:hypothetical protein